MKISLLQNVDVRIAMKVVHFFSQPIGCWPSSKGATICQRFWHEFAWAFVMTHVVLLEFGNFYSLINKHTSSEIVLIFAELAGCGLIQGKMIGCKRSRKLLSVVLGQIEEFVEKMNPEEKEIIQKIINLCAWNHVPIIFASVVGPVMYMISPRFTDVLLPSTAMYPFSVDPIPIRVFLYISQSIALDAFGFTSIINMLCAILVWYAVARFRMLSARLRRATTAEEVTACIAHHVELLVLVDEMMDFIRWTAVCGVSMTLIGITCSGYLLMVDTPAFQVVALVCYELVAVVELFLICWPAENLKNATDDVADALYSCDWVGLPKHTRKNIMMTMTRARQPIVVSVGGIFPALSLEFYASTLSANFGYLTTLRAFIDT